MTTIPAPKYVLLNEETGQVVEVLAHEDKQVFADEAFEIATLVRPNWRQEGLKLWLRVGGQS